MEERSSIPPMTVVGIALVVFGGFLMVKAFGSYIPGFEIVMDVWERAGWPLAVIAGGVAIVVAARRPGFRMPDARTRLVRSADERMLAGVLGGIARHFGIDPTLARLAFIAVALATDFGSAVVVYILMAIIMPKAPAGPPVDAS